LRSLPRLQNIVLHARRPAELLRFDESAPSLHTAEPVGKAEHRQKGYARSAYLAAFGKAAELQLEGQLPDFVTVLASLPSPSSLRRLSLSGQDITSTRTSSAQDAKRLLTRLSLEHLSLVEQAGWGAGATWLDNMTLTSLTSLSLNVTAATFALFENLDHFAPNLVSLDLKIECHIDNIDHEYRPFQLPKLRYVTVSGAEWDFSLLKAFSSGSPSLHRISLIHTHPEISALSFILYSSIALPPSLRSLHFDLNTPSKPTDRASYSASLAERNITVSLRWSPNFDVLRTTVQQIQARGGNRPDNEDKHFVKEKKRIIDETLDWARQHANHLDAVDDDAAFDYLGQALVRVRQLQVWQQQ
jgi:hypothetical protein